MVVCAFSPRKLETFRKWPWPLAIVALFTAVLAACSQVPVALQLPTPTVAVEGLVIDAESDRPIPGATVQVKGAGDNVTLTTDGEGRYVAEGLLGDATLEISARGYRGTTFPVGAGGPLTTKLEPVTLAGRVVDAYSGQPLAGVRVSQGDSRTVTNASGEYRLVAVLADGPVAWALDGYEGKEATPGTAGRLDVELRPNTLAGRVARARTGEPIAGATVTLGGAVVTTDSEGRYRLNDAPEKGILLVKASGFDSVRLEVERQAVLDAELRPFEVRAGYLTYYGVGSFLRDNVLEVIESTELNGVVIDVKGDFGRLTYKSSVPLAERIGANSEPTVGDMKALLDELRGKGIYTIARIVVFKDDVLGRNGAAAGLDVAIRDSRNGGPWIDGENLVWVDPFRTEVWEYNIALAVEAAKMGFDEIQFDYIRFPTDPSPGGTVGAAVYSQTPNEANRVATITGFLARAKEALHPLGVYIGIDVFGYTCWREDDMGIGQHIESIAPHVDFICPMVYPSTYSDGLPMEPRYLDAPAYPYEIVYYSVKSAVERLREFPVKVRPWLQYFDDYPWASGREYNAPEIEAQIRAGIDGGGVGYMMWDPTNRFSRGGLGSPR